MSEIDDIVEQLRKRLSKSVPEDWKKGRKCPACDASAERQKCMWESPLCPRSDPSAYSPSPYITKPDPLCDEAAALIVSLREENERLQTALAKAKAEAEWRDIETAPKHGTLIDLWCVTPPEIDYVPESGGIRLTDCSWREADDIFPHTGWVRITDDGDCDFVTSPPTCQFGLPTWIPTHWMPRPTQPRGESK